MIAPFDIFQTQADGTSLWRGAAETIDEAKARIADLAAQSPGEYVLLSRRTGNREVIRPDDAASE